jgi:hypothetical protein
MISARTGDLTDEAIRLAHKREVNFERNACPEYRVKTAALPFERYADETLAASADNLMHGSNPPAVSGETAPAASPINKPLLFAILFRTPPTGIRPPRRSTRVAICKSRMPRTSRWNSSSAEVGSKRFG